MLWTFEQVLLLVCAVADLIVAVGAGVNYYQSPLTPKEGVNGRRAERSRKAKVTLVVVIIVCVLFGSLLIVSQTALAQPLVQRALCPSPALSTDYPVYTGTGLTPSFDFGIDSSEHQYNWFTDEHGSILIDYPSQQQWGTLFVTKGPASALGAARGALDVSAFNCLSVQMRGAVGGEQVGVSIKDLATPNNGPSLHTAQQQLTTNWQTYRFPLSAFAHTNLTQVFVVFEMDFAGTSNLQVEFRNLYFFS